MESMRKVDQTRNIELLNALEAVNASQINNKKEILEEIEGEFEGEEALQKAFARGVEAAFDSVEGACVIDVHDELLPLKEQVKTIFKSLGNLEDQSSEDIFDYGFKTALTKIKETVPGV